jgi:hypothetical protein
MMTGREALTIRFGALAEVITGRPLLKESRYDVTVKPREFRSSQHVFLQLEHCPIGLYKTWPWNYSGLYEVVGKAGLLNYPA